MLLTPIVVAILVRLEFSPAATLAFIVATGFVADTTSLPLIISNLVNIVSANYFGVSFDRYAAVMVPVDVVALVATLAVLWTFYGGRFPRPIRRRTWRRRAPPSATVPCSAPRSRCWPCCWSPTSSWRRWACRCRR